LRIPGTLYGSVQKTQPSTSGEATRRARTSELVLTLSAGTRPNSIYRAFGMIDRPVRLRFLSRTHSVSSSQLLLLCCGATMQSYAYVRRIPRACIEIICMLTPPVPSLYVFICISCISKSSFCDGTKKDKSTKFIASTSESLPLFAGFPCT